MNYNNLTLSVNDLITGFLLRYLIMFFIKNCRFCKTNDADSKQKMHCKFNTENVQPPTHDKNTGGLKKEITPD